MKSNFQTILLAIFLAFFVFAVLIFSGLLPIGQKNTATQLSGTITMWGTVPTIDFSKVIEEVNGNNPDLTINYLYKRKDEYASELVKAIATGTGPDIFMLSDDMLLQEQSFIFPIPYTTYPEKSFRDTFADGNEVFLGTDGVLALPISMDPLVMYYNKDILSNNGIARAPVYWDDLIELNGTLTKTTFDGAISDSLIALGTYDNLTHAKDILALLMIQSGNPITKKENGMIVSVLDDQFNQNNPPAESVLEFFSQFSNPTSTLYSWNRGMPMSKDYFTGGTLAIYIGRGSELFNIQSVNPNLAFDVSSILQTKGTNTKRTFASINAVAVSKSTKDPVLATSTALLFTDPVVSKMVATSLSLPPARRDLLSERPTDPYLMVFYDSAIYARTWLDPDSASTNTIFRDMISNIVSNKLDIGDAVSRANAELDLLLRK